VAKALILTIITGTRIGQNYEVSTRSSVIGSDPDCDVVIHDRLIEPRHAEIRHMLDSWFVTPLSAHASVSVNGRAATSQSRLKPGDKLTLGTTTLEASVHELQEQIVGGPALSSTGVPRIGEYFLRHGLMTPEQVRMAVERQAALQRSGSIRPLGEVAYEMGFVNRSQLDRALNDQRTDFNSRWHD
jgi:predicted component of type VI protein secretion system